MLGHNIVPSDVDEIARTVEPIQVEVIDTPPWGDVFVHERKSWARHVLRDSEPFGDRLDQRRFSRAEFTLQRDDTWQRQGTTQGIAPRHEL